MCDCRARNNFFSIFPCAFLFCPLPALAAIFLALKAAQLAAQSNTKLKHPMCCCLPVIFTLALTKKRELPGMTEISQYENDAVSMDVIIITSSEYKRRIVFGCTNWNYRMRVCCGMAPNAAIMVCEALDSDLLLECRKIISLTRIFFSLPLFQRINNYYHTTHAHAVRCGFHLAGRTKSWRLLMMPFGTCSEQKRSDRKVRYELIPW